MVTSSPGGGLWGLRDNPSESLAGQRRHRKRTKFKIIWGESSPPQISGLQSREDICAGQQGQVAQGFWQDRRLQQLGSLRQASLASTSTALFGAVRKGQAVIPPLCEETNR